MKLLQIRNVPDHLHRALKERAAREGTTMSELVLRDLPRIAQKPSAEQVIARIRSREPVRGLNSTADLIRRDRESR
ncbi:MAG: antitoxin FitA [Thermoleophilaceae bacterium]|jgi:plasmid stability protein|nr:antitoxin FitA [Thermoleophilaceae bacterium]